MRSLSAFPKTAHTPRATILVDYPREKTMNKRVISVLLCALILSGCAAKTPDVVPENTEEAEESGKQTTSAEAEQNDEANPR